MNDQTLTEAEIADLRCLAGMIIPPSAKYGVPGADDDTIFSDIVNSIGRDNSHVRAALARLRALAGGPFAALDAARRREVAAKLRADGGVAGQCAHPGCAALLLPRRPRDGFARPGGAAALPQGPRARAGRLVAARPGAGPQAVLAPGWVGRLCAGEPRSGAQASAAQST